MMRLHKNNSICTYERRYVGIEEETEKKRKRKDWGNYQCDYGAYAPVTYFHIQPVEVSIRKVKRKIYTFVSFYILLTSHQSSQSVIWNLEWKKVEFLLLLFASGKEHFANIHFYRKTQIISLKLIQNIH